MPKAADNADVVAKVKKLVDELRPYIQMDGGNVDFVKYEDNIVYLQLSGACVGCPSSQVTLKMGLERRIKDEIPEVQAVESIG